MKHYELRKASGPGFDMTYPCPVCCAVVLVNFPALGFGPRRDVIDAMRADPKPCGYPDCEANRHTDPPDTRKCKNCGAAVKYDAPGTLQGDAWAAGICARLMLAVCSVDALPCTGS